MGSFSGTGPNAHRRRATGSGPAGRLRRRRAPLPTCRRCGARPDCIRDGRAGRRRGGRRVAHRMSARRPGHRADGSAAPATRRTRAPRRVDPAWSTCCAEGADGADEPMRSRRARRTAPPWWPYWCRSIGRPTELRGRRSWQRVRERGRRWQMPEQSLSPPMCCPCRGGCLRRATGRSPRMVSATCRPLSPRRCTSG